MSSVDGGLLFSPLGVDGHHQIAFKIVHGKTLKHSLHEPCIWTGDGQIKFTEHEGHFNIDDPLGCQRRPLFASVEPSNTTAVLVDADGRGPASAKQQCSNDKTSVGFQVSSSQATSETSKPEEERVRMTVSNTIMLLETADGEHMSTTTPITKAVIKIDGSATNDADGSLFHRVWLRFPFAHDDHFYGAGEQFSHFDLRGRKFPIWTREQGVGRDPCHPLWAAAEQFGTGYGGDYHTTYFPQASFVSSRGVYFFVSDHFENGTAENDGEKPVENLHCGTFYSELDFSSFQPDTRIPAEVGETAEEERESYVQVMLYGRFPFECTLLLADSCTQAVQAFTSLFGVPLRIPAWVHQGAILGLQGGTNEVEKTVQKLLDAGGVVRGLWIQDWVGKFNTSFGQRLFWNWVWDPERYPQLPELVRRLRTQHEIRTLGYASPHVRRDASLFEEAEQRNFLVLEDNTRQPLIQDFGEFFCGTIDLTNKDAREWFRDTLQKNMIEAIGFSGWMADFSEYIPAHARFANGMTGTEAHNRFPVMWAKLNHDIIVSKTDNNNGFDEIMYWMRAGGLGSQRYMQMLWAGDQCQSFEPKADGLASVIPAFLSAGMSGAGVNHFDIGLFTGFDVPNNVEVSPFIRTKQLLLRSAEMAVFTPVFRTHEGNRPKLSHQFYSDEASLNVFALYTQAHAALAPYHSYVINERRTQFLPVFRPMVFFLERAQQHLKHHQQPNIALQPDIVEACLTVQDQYGYGDMLLVAPVVDENTTTRRVLLPPLVSAKSGGGSRQWLHLPTSTRYDSGQWVTVDANLGEPPVFVDIGHECADKFLELFSQLTVIFKQIATCP